MDNDDDMVEKAVRCIVYIIYDETSLSGLTMALSACIWRGGGAFSTVSPKVTQMGSTIGLEYCHG